MKKLLSIFTLLLFCLIGNSATYYVSDSDGNDSDSGLTTALAWKTLAKVSATTFANGDRILFKRGDTFVGTLTLTKSSVSGSPIVYGAYGTGAKPIITSMATLTGWTLHSGKIYKVSGMPANCDVVTINGVSVSMGKFPQTGNNTFESYSGITSITDNQLTGSPNWTGAEVVIWKSNWTIDRGAITNHVTTTLTYTSGSTYAVQSSGGQKYYIQRSLAACTYQGAWYCDGTDFYMYFENNDPNNFVVKAGASDYTVYGTGKSYNTLRDVEVQGGNLAAIYMTSLNGFSFRNSTLKNTGLLGLTATNSTTITTVDSCAISYVNGTGISIVSNSSYIGHSTFDKCGQFAGMGEAGGGSHYAIYTKGTNNITEYNNITNTGYIPIYYVSSGSIVRYNVVDTYPTLLLNDGGGIYTFESVRPQTAKKCYNNIISNSTANGLYSDGIANNVEFYNNIVYNVDKWGIHMNMPTNNSVHDNVFCDFGLAGIDVTNQTLLGTYYTASGNTVYNNTLIQDVGTQNFYSLQDAQANNILNFGTSNNNTFIADNSATTTFFNLYVLPSFHSTYYTLANWKTLTGFEATSTYKSKDLSTLNFLYNDTKVPKDFVLPYASIDMSDQKYTGTVTLQPFAYLALIQDPSPTPTPPATGNSAGLVNGKAGLVGTKIGLR